MKFWFIIIFITLSLVCEGQHRSNIWCFGDSAGIDFNNLSNPVPINTGLRTRGSCSSISDTLGQLLFYANDRTNTSGSFTTLVYNDMHQIMPNGDSIVGEGWYNEMLILPIPLNDSLYYLFNLSTALGPMGLYYSIVDMNADSGRGDVIAKNIQLQPFPISDCLNAVKHGNGRDWWLIFRSYDGSNVTTNNQFYIYLISPYGITNFQTQNVGSMHNSGLGQISFNKQGSKISFNSYKGTLEIFDFDRCSGIISNSEVIFLENTIGPWPARWSSEFSPNSQFLYSCKNNDTTFLIQYDLTASNIISSADTIWSTLFPRWSGGKLKRGPDDKIYFSCVYYNGVQFYYPYADSMYNAYNMNLSVINQPDNLGSGCNFQPYSFYLGGKRTYLGLPNNPDYDLGPLVGSPCDTLVGINDLNMNNSISPELFVYYDFGWQTAFINARTLKGKFYSLSIYDLLGKEIFIESGKINSSYFTKNLDCSTFSKGMYLVVFQSDEEKLVKRFVIE